MPFLRALTVIASLCLAISLSACAGSDALAPVDVTTRVTLPAPPADLAACFDKPFPTIPGRALTTADVVRIIGTAKVLDRERVGCGKRAESWIAAVRRDFAK